MVSSLGLRLRKDHFLLHRQELMEDSIFFGCRMKAFGFSLIVAIPITIDAAIIQVKMSAIPAVYA